MQMKIKTKSKKSNQCQLKTKQILYETLLIVFRKKKEIIVITKNENSRKSILWGAEGMMP